MKMDKLTLIHKKDDFKLLLNGNELKSVTKYTLTAESRSDLTLRLEIMVDIDDVEINENVNLL